MNIEQANAIPLSEILEKIGHLPERIRGNEAWYLSPFREEKTPSFHIHLVRNCWYDFGENVGGDVVNFVGFWLRRNLHRHQTVDVLEWLRNRMPDVPRVVKPVHVQTKEEKMKTLILQSVSPHLRHEGLLKYIVERGIPVDLARKYLREIVITNQNSGKIIHALGMQNEEEGYELRNAFLKNCTGKKAPTFIPGAKEAPNEIHVFEGMFDFLGALAQENKECFDGDVLILHSAGLVQWARKWISDDVYETVYSWMDNDAAGKNAATALRKMTARSAFMFFKEMNGRYEAFKDVNEWRMKKPIATILR